MHEENEIIKPGQAVIIADGAQLESAIEKIVWRSMEKFYAAKVQEAKEKDWVEQHVAADMLGVSIWTLARRSKAGQIERVPAELVHTRDVYYYMRDLEKERLALEAKRALKKRNAQKALENKNTLSHED